MQVVRNTLAAAAFLGCAALSSAQTEVVLDNGDTGFTSYNEAGSLPGVPILMYHYLADPSGFDAQMDWLVANDFECITLEHLVSWVESGQPELPDRPVIITFDDNYISVWDTAYPKMKALQQQGHTIFGYNFTHTMYVGVVTSLDHPDWNEIRIMDEDGVLFTESHTVSHPNLPALTLQQETDEIFNSKTIIEQEIGREAPWFAYPYGAYDAETISLVEMAGYKGAVSTIADYNRRDTPIYELRRFDVNSGMGTGPSFTSKLDDALGTGAWSPSTSQLGYIGSNYVYAIPGDGSRGAVWRLSAPATGLFSVEANWTDHANRATNAPYTVEHADTETTVRVNQQLNGGTWNELTVLQLSADDRVTITLTNDADGIVIADAVRLRQISVPLSDIWLMK